MLPKTNRWPTAPRKRRGLLFNVTYAVFYGTDSWCVPFFPILFTNLGYSNLQIGSLAACNFVAGLTGNPALNTLAELSGRVRLVNVSAYIMSCTFRVLLFSRSHFAASLSFMFLSQFFGAASGSMIDSCCLQMCDDFGKHRLWGGVGFGTMSLAAGLVISSFGLATSFGVYVAFAAASVALLVVLPMPHATPLSDPALQAGASRLEPLLPPPASAATRAHGSDTEGSPPLPAPAAAAADFCDQLRRLLSLPVLLFLSVVYCMGTIMGAIVTFLFLRLRALGAPDWLLGLSLACTCLSEVPFMYLSSRLMRRLGIHGTVALGLGCYFLRVLGYSLLVNPLLVLPLELLHGITFGVTWAAIASYADQVAPPGLHASTQSLFSAVHYGLGNGSGALLGGLVFQAWGAVVLFRCCCAVALLAMVLLACSTRQAQHCRGERCTVLATEGTPPVVEAPEGDHPTSAPLTDSANSSLHPAPLGCGRGDIYLPPARTLTPVRCL